MVLYTKIDKLFLICYIRKKKFITKSPVQRSHEKAWKTLKRGSGIIVMEAYKTVQDFMSAKFGKINAQIMVLNSFSEKSKIGKENAVKVLAKTRGVSEFIKKTIESRPFFTEWNGHKNVPLSVLVESEVSPKHAIVSVFINQKPFLKYEDPDSIDYGQW